MTSAYTSTHLYNSLIVSNTLFCLNRVGIFKDFEKTENLPVDDYVVYNQLIDVCIRSGYMKLDNNLLSLTPEGKLVAKDIGFFTWVVGGYSKLLSSMDELINGSLRSEDGLIDGMYVAKGSGECNIKIFSGLVNDVINKLDIKYLADLGCGDGNFIFQVASQKKDMRAIGIDISEKALNSAKDNASTMKLCNRVNFTCHNVIELLFSGNVYRGVDTVTCFMMMHDLMNDERLKGKIFHYLSQVFPDAETFIIADTMLTENKKRVSQTPIFSLGFELIHTVRGIKLFTQREYLEEFSSGGLKVVEDVHLGISNTYLFVLSKER